MKREEKKKEETPEFKKCPVCPKMVRNVLRHVKEVHSLDTKALRKNAEKGETPAQKRENRRLLQKAKREVVNYKIFYSKILIISFC